MAGVWAACSPCRRVFYCCDDEDALVNERAWRVCPVCMTPGQVLAAPDVIIDLSSEPA